MSSSELELRFRGKAYAVPKKFVVDLLDQRNLFAATSYAVESSVPVELFEAFVVSLQTQRKASVTYEGKRSFSVVLCEGILSFGTFVGVFVRTSDDSSGASFSLETGDSGEGRRGG
jgi:hypothetical protein